MANEVATKGTNIPAIAEKWAAVGEVMDGVVADVALSKTIGMSNFKRAMLTAVAVQHLRSQLTEEMMKPILALQGTGLGFRTDKDKEGGYPFPIVRDCVIDAALRGCSLIGNELNIIADRPYYTKEYYQRVVGQLPGVTDVEPSLGVPDIKGNLATIEADCTWNYNKTACRVTPGPGRKEGRVLSIRVNSGQGPDQVIGKATRKLFKAVYEQITGSTSSDDNDDYIEGTVVNGSGSPPVGRTNIQANGGTTNGGHTANGNKPNVPNMPIEKGPACKVEWDAIQNFTKAYSEGTVAEAKAECGFGAIPLDSCNARQLGEIRDKLIEWEVNGRVGKAEDKKKPVSAGKKDTLNF